MAVEDITILLVFAGILNYLIFYQKNHVFGNIVFMLMGIGMMYLVQDNGWVGWIVFLGALGSLIYDVLSFKE